MATFKIVAYCIETLVIIFLLVYIINDLRGGEDFKTSKQATKKIGQIINESKFSDGLLYDLGSSRGSFLIQLSKLCPKLRLVGIDDSLFRINISKLRSPLTFDGRLSFLQQDFFETDISKTDIVFIYVPKELLPKLEEKLKELKSGSLVITYRIKLPTWEPRQVFETDFNEETTRHNIFLYHIS